MWSSVPGSPFACGGGVEPKGRFARLSGMGVVLRGAACRGVRAPLCLRDDWGLKELLEEVMRGLT